MQLQDRRVKGREGTISAGAGREVVPTSASGPDSQCASPGIELEQLYVLIGDGKGIPVCRLKADTVIIGHETPPATPEQMVVADDDDLAVG